MTDVVVTEFMDPDGVARLNRHFRTHYDPTLVDKPDVRGREEVLRIHTKAVRLSPGVVLKVVAARTAGFAGADLANLVNEAALLATRRQAAHVTLDDFTRAIERIVAGLEKKNRLLNPMERRVVARRS